MLRLDFFYGIGGRYSYLASTQIARLEADTGCRPLDSGDLFAVRGTDPFAGAPVSGQYDWGLSMRRCRSISATTACSSCATRC
ncbi:MAG: hypothetical protein ACREH6_12145 [Geminicoccaceae bacterium]